jgi:hypothetical protein
MDVIEHIYDVPSFLGQVVKRLRADGMLVMLTGNINSFLARMAKNNWWYVRYPEHVRFPSLRWLRRHPGFRLTRVVRVHASEGYVHPLTFSDAISALQRWMRGQYDGMPVLLPDHDVVALNVRKHLDDG